MVAGGPAGNDRNKVADINMEVFVGDGVAGEIRAEAREDATKNEAIVVEESGAEVGVVFEDEFEEYSKNNLRVLGFAGEEFFEFLDNFAFVFVKSFGAVDVVMEVKSGVGDMGLTTEISNANGDTAGAESAMKNSVDALFAAEVTFVSNVFGLAFAGFSGLTARFTRICLFHNMALIR